MMIYLVPPSSFFRIPRLWQKHKLDYIPDSNSCHSIDEHSLFPTPLKTPGVSSSPSKPQPAIVVEQRSNRGKVDDTSTCSMVAPSSVPSLSGPSTASSPRSKLESLDLGFDYRLGRTLQEDENGILIDPSAATFLNQENNVYPCIFSHVFNCQKLYSHAEEWKTHVTSHFRSHLPPKAVNCPVCKQRFSGITQQRRTDIAWRTMLDHILHRHFNNSSPQQQQQGRGHCSLIDDIRPDFELMRYMYCIGVITPEQFKLLQLSTQQLRDTAGSSDEPYFIHANPQRERRLRGRPRVPVI